MSKKRYQISPIEFIQWAEPLFGYRKGKATGFSEKTVASYEEEAGIHLPAALREYYLACGKASLNCALHEIFGNYLLFWCENQGCWYAGIKAEDLTRPNPAVYYNDQDDVYSWAPFSDSVQSFLLNIILLNLEARVRPDRIDDSAEIQKVLAGGGVDFQRLCEPYPFPGGRFCHTCLDIVTNTLYVYGEEAEGRPAYLKVFKPKKEE